MLDWNDPIVALASPPGVARRGIIRLTGEGTHEIVATHLQGRGALLALPWNRQRWFQANFKLTEGGRAVPIDIFAWPRGRSATGQPMAELHFPFTGVVLDGAIAGLIDAGARQARPGEFTLRAFLAGRVDLVQAEGILGVVQSEDVVSLRQAIDWRTGGASQPLAEVKDSLLNLLADVEAGLDFVEEDISFTTREEIDRQLTQARHALSSIAGRFESRRHEDQKPRVVLIGQPNAGKSSLFNALLGQARAIVHDRDGTTRDTIEADAEWRGISLRLVDTAGIETAEDAIMRQAGQRREDALRSADLLVWCHPANLTPSDEVCSSLEPQSMSVWTKSDLAESREATGICVSIFDPASIESCREEIARRLANRGRADSSLWGTTLRMRECLSNTLKTLDGMLASPTEDQEVIAADLRDLLHHLGEALGHVYTEDLLDRVFSRFCIGK